MTNLASVDGTGQLLPFVIKIQSNHEEKKFSSRFQRLKFKRNGTGLGVGVTSKPLRPPSPNITSVGPSIQSEWTILRHSLIIGHNTP